MTRILLVDSPSEARWAVEDRPDLVVAMNARAVDALTKLGAPHAAIGEYVSGSALAALDEIVVDQTVALVKRIERRLAAGDTYARYLAEHEILSGQVYFLCHAASMIAARASMIRNVIERAGSGVQLIAGDEVHPLFAAHGYSRSPWLDTAQRMVSAASGHLEIRRTLSAPASGDGILGPEGLLRRGARPVATWLRRRLRQIRRPIASAPEEGARLLIVDGISHDWSPIAEQLTARGIRIFTLVTSTFEQQAWFPVFTGPLRDAHGTTIAALPALEIEDAAPAGAAIDAWRAADRSWTFDAGSIDILPDLMPYVRSLGGQAASLVASIDRIAIAALDGAQPDVVGFWAMASFAGGRFAVHARRRGVSVVCYQHGGAYGTHRIASHALLEPGLADDLLTYGDGVVFEPSAYAAAPARTWPVGSARIEAFRGLQESRASQPSTHHPVRVLWAAELSTSNTASSGWLVEDTTRFAMERQGLELLARAGSFEVCYRPHPGNERDVATVGWLQRADLSGVRVDSSSPMAGLIAEADVVVTMSSSGTIWNEVLAFAKPLLLFCERDHPGLYPVFAETLERACIWCQSRDAFESALATLAADPLGTVAAWRRPTAAFVARFVLPDDQKMCAGRVYDVLNLVARRRMVPIDAAAVSKLL